MSEPTLLVLLESEALHLDIQADDRRGAPIEPVLRQRAVDLRAAADRMKREMEVAAGMRGDYNNSEDLALLERINGGPMADEPPGGKR